MKIESVNLDEELEDDMKVLKDQLNTLYDSRYKKDNDWTKAESFK